MYVVFEDKKDDILSKLFMSAYSENSFIYTEGNGNIIKNVEELVNKTNDFILVYLDTVPDNSSIPKIYNKLRLISRRNDYRVIVLPIVCAEYYFIKSLKEHMFTSRVGLDECLERKYWCNSKLIDDSDLRFLKNFEKYCKLILIKSVRDCVKHTRTNNNLYAMFYETDCYCNSSNKECDNYKLVDKAISYVYEYPIFPCEKFLGKIITESKVDLWEVHRQLVDEYNKMCDDFASVSSISYSKLNYINYDIEYIG